MKICFAYTRTSKRYYVQYFTFRLTLGKAIFTFALSTYIFRYFSNTRLGGRSSGYTATSKHVPALKNVFGKDYAHNRSYEKDFEIPVVYMTSLVRKSDLEYLGKTLDIRTLVDRYTAVVLFYICSHKVWIEEEITKNTYIRLKLSHAK